MLYSEYETSCVNAARAAFDIARHAARLPVEMKPQRQRMQMAEHLQRELPHRAFGHLRKQDFAQLGEKRGGQPHDRIRHHQQADATHQHDARANRARVRARSDAAPKLRLSTIFFITIGTPRLATFAPIRQRQRERDAPLIGGQVGQQRAGSSASRCAGLWRREPVRRENCGAWIRGLQRSAPQRPKCQTAPDERGIAGRAPI